jgi:hypothetical protein
MFNDLSPFFYYITRKNWSNNWNAMSSPPSVIRIVIYPMKKLRGYSQSNTSFHLTHIPVSDYFTQTLTTLNLDDNEIGALGVQHLSEALKHNTVSQVVVYICVVLVFLLISQTLTTLNLNGDQIGAVGAQHLNEALRHNTVSTIVRFIYFILVLLFISHRHLQHSTSTGMKSAIQVHNISVRHYDITRWVREFSASNSYFGFWLFHTDTDKTQPGLQSNRSCRRTISEWGITT